MTKGMQEKLIDYIINSLDYRNGVLDDCYEVLNSEEINTIYEEIDMFIELLSLVSNPEVLEK
jgi:hypothetical protein